MRGESINYYILLLHECSVAEFDLVINKVRTGGGVVRVYAEKDDKKKKVATREDEMRDSQNARVKEFFHFFFPFFVFFFSFEISTSDNDEVFLSI